MTASKNRDQRAWSTRKNYRVGAADEIRAEARRVWKNAVAWIKRGIDPVAIRVIPLAAYAYMGHVNLDDMPFEMRYALKVPDIPEGTVAYHLRRLGMDPGRAEAISKECRESWNGGKSRTTRAEFWKQKKAQEKET